MRLSWRCNRRATPRPKRATWQPPLGGAPFVLVTSAYHMPRAVRLMQRAGQHPIPAPTGQRVGAFPWRGFHRWLPTSAGLRDTELALHEYLGLAALTLGIS